MIEGTFSRTQIEEPRVGRRFSTIPMLTITATTALTAQTLYTVAAKRVIDIKSLMVSNITATDAVFHLYAVPLGGAADVNTVLIAGVVIKANASDNLVKYINNLYVAQTSLRAFCNTASAVKFMGMVEEMF